MSTPYTDTDIALPHASLLSYFRRPAPPPEPRISSESSPPPYSDCEHAHPAVFHDDEDEESHCGFQCERILFHGNDNKDGINIPYVKRGLRNTSCKTRGAYAFCCFWCAVSICILSAFGIFFLVDLGFSQFGHGTGIAEWIVHGDQTRHSKHVEMRFCLATPNRDAPGPQMWRYMTPKPNVYEECATEIATLLARPEELARIHPSDSISVSRSMRFRDRDVRDRKVKEKSRAVELGDDLAEEGGLSLRH